MSLSAGNAMRAPVSFSRWLVQCVVSFQQITRQFHAVTKLYFYSRERRHVLYSSVSVHQPHFSERETRKRKEVKRTQSRLPCALLLVSLYSKGSWLCRMKRKRAWTRQLSWWHLVAFYEPVVRILWEVDSIKNRPLMRKERERRNKSRQWIPRLNPRCAYSIQPWFLYYSRDAWPENVDSWRNDGRSEHGALIFCRVFSRLRFRFLVFAGRQPSLCLPK